MSRAVFPDAAKLADLAVARAQAVSQQERQPWKS